MATWNDLKTFLGSDDSDDTYVMSCYNTALALVEAFIGTNNSVPASIKDRCVLNVGQELFHQKDAPSGIAQYSQFENAPIRVARDPMVAAYPLLSRYMVVGL